MELLFQLLYFPQFPLCPTSFPPHQISNQAAKRAKWKISKKLHARQKVACSLANTQIYIQRAIGSKVSSFADIYGIYKFHLACL